MALPTGFSDLSTAYNAAQYTIVHIIGFVVDAMTPSTTRTGDFMMTLKLLDVPLHEATYGSHGLQMRYFNKDRRQLPQVQQGDVVMLRSVKMSRFSGQPIAMSNYQTTSFPPPSSSPPSELRLHRHPTARPPHRSQHHTPRCSTQTGGYSTPLLPLHPVVACKQEPGQG